MSSVVIFSVASLVFGCAAGWLNACITSSLVTTNTSVNKIMLCNFVHIVIAALALAVILLVGRFIKVDCTVPLLVGAAGVVLVPIAVAFMKSRHN